MKLIIYDVEVLKYHWTIVLKYYGEDTYYEIVDNPDAFRRFYEDNKTNIWVGFNIKHYDVHILRSILSGKSVSEVYDVSKKIIEDRVPGWRIPGIKRFPFVSFDLSDDIQGAPMLSLKEAEANMGLSIVESTIPFDIDRPLTDDEMEELLDYNTYDVYATEALFEEPDRFEYFQGKVRLTQHFDLGLQNIEKTTAQLTAMILDARKPRARYDEMIYDMPDEVEVMDGEIVELYQSPINYKNTLTKDIAGIPHKLAYGGLHGGENKVQLEGDMVLLDVVQYYPSLMNRFGFISRNVRSPERFEEITRERLRYKAENSNMNYPFKIIIAATYGAMKNRYNGLYDPKMPNQVCITGQLLLVDLIEKLTPEYAELIQSNTDGILIIPRDLEAVKQIVSEWEERTGMIMEWDWGTGIWQKDVNNYIYKHKDGSLTVKGGYVKQYYHTDYRKNTLRIVDRAVVDYIVHGVPVEDTVYGESELIQFQMIAKSGRSFDRNVHYTAGGEIVVNKTSRVFATKDNMYGKVYKVKQDSYHAIPSIPDHCYIYNEDIGGVTVDEIGFPLDRDWYVEVAKDRIRDFGVKIK